MSPEFPPPQQSFISWMLQALGYKYALVIPLASLVSLLLSLVLTLRAKGPMWGFVLVLIVPVPFLIGVFAGIEHAIAALRLIAVSAGSARESQFAEGIATALVAPMVGLSMMVPGYGVAVIGSLLRSFRTDTTNARG